MKESLRVIKTDLITAAEERFKGTPYEDKVDISMKTFSSFLERKKTPTIIYYTDPSMAPKIIEFTPEAEKQTLLKPIKDMTDIELVTCWEALTSRPFKNENKLDPVDEEIHKLATEVWDEIYTRDLGNYNPLFDKALSGLISRQKPI